MNNAIFRHLSASTMLLLAILPALAQQSYSETARQIAQRIGDKLAPSHMLHIANGEVLYETETYHADEQKRQAAMNNVEWAAEMLDVMPYTKRMRSEEIVNGYCQTNYLLLLSDSVAGMSSFIQVRSDAACTRMVYHQRNGKVLSDAAVPTAGIDSLIAAYTSRLGVKNHTMRFQGNYQSCLIAERGAITDATIYRIPRCQPSDYASIKAMMHNLRKNAGVELIETEAYGMLAQTAVRMRDVYGEQHFYAAQLHADGTLRIIHALPIKNWKDKLIIPTGWAYMADNADVQLMDDSVTIGGDVVYSAGEQMPCFVGGTDALNRYMTDYLRSAKDASEGIIRVRCYVTPDGQVHCTEVLDAPNRHTANLAVQAMRAMPRWKPGRHNGREACIRVGFTLHFDPQNNAVK